MLYSIDILKSQTINILIEPRENNFSHRQLSLLYTVFIKFQYYI